MTAPRGHFTSLSLVRQGAFTPQDPRARAQEPRSGEPSLDLTSPGGLSSNQRPTRCGLQGRWAWVPPPRPSQKPPRQGLGDHGSGCPAWASALPGQRREKEASAGKSVRTQWEEQVSR